MGLNSGTLIGMVKTKSREVRLGRYSEMGRPNASQFVAQQTSKLLYSTLPQAAPFSLITDPLLKRGIALSGVNEITFGVTPDIGIGNGLIQSVLQPFPVQPTKITVEADSYMGAITLISPSDDDVNQILKRLYQTLDEFWLIGSAAPNSPAKEAMILEIDNNPPTHKSFVGFITNFVYKESNKQPYLFTYTLEFVGFPKLSDSVAQAKGVAQAGF
jgi:hypothetical protein